MSASVAELRPPASAFLDAEVLHSSQQELHQKARALLKPIAYDGFREDFHPFLTLSEIEKLRPGFGITQPLFDASTKPHYECKYILSNGHFVGVNFTPNDILFPLARNYDSNTTHQDISNLDLSSITREFNNRKKEQQPSYSERGILHKFVDFFIEQNEEEVGRLISPSGGKQFWFPETNIGSENDQTDSAPDHILLDSNEGIFLIDQYHAIPGVNRNARSWQKAKQMRKHVADMSLLLKKTCGPSVMPRIIPVLIKFTAFESELALTIRPYIRRDQPNATTVFSST